MSGATMIDAFSHILPHRYLKRVNALYPGTFSAADLAPRKSLYDIESRLTVMDAFPGYAQILTLAQPAIESLGDGSAAHDLARTANEGMAELCRADPDRFLGFAAALPAHDPEAAIRELERATSEYGALGAQIHTNVRGVAWDDPRFAVFWQAVERLDQTLWVHPARGPAFADYASEEDSRYGTFMAFGWPYETAVFMTRLVFSGIVERHRSLRILTHHAGGMIPHFAQRIGKSVGMLPQGWPRDPAEITRRANELLRHFYGDTSLNGYLPAVRCGLDYFGVERLLFGTDMPWDESNGSDYVRDTIQNVRDLEVSEADRDRIFAGNARRVLGVR